MLSKAEFNALAESPTRNYAMLCVALFNQAGAMSHGLRCAEADRLDAVSEATRRAIERLTRPCRWHNAFAYFVYRLERDMWKERERLRRRRLRSVPLRERYL